MIVEYLPTCKSNNSTLLSCHRGECFTFVYHSDDNSISDIHTLPFGIFTLPFSLIVIIVRSMSNIATEISVDDWLSLLPNVVKSRSIFQMVIITYFYAVIISYAAILGLYSQREYAYWE